MRFDIKALKVGQKVYVKPVGNSARYIKDNILDNIKESEVEKIGKKYFYLKEFSREKFGFEYADSNICSSISDYSANFEVYLSKQDIMDDIERNKIIYELKQFFYYYGQSKYLTLEQLRKIKEITNKIESK